MIKDILFNEIHYSEAAGINTLVLSLPWDPYHFLSPRICEDLKITSLSQFNSEPHIKLQEDLQSFIVIWNKQLGSAISKLANLPLMAIPLSS